MLPIALAATVEERLEALRSFKPDALYGQLGLAAAGSSDGVHVHTVSGVLGNRRTDKNGAI